MSLPWKRIDPSVNRAVRQASGASPEPPASGGGEGPPLTHKMGGTAAPDGWEKLFTVAAPRHRIEDLVLAPAVRTQLEDALALVTCYAILYKAWRMEDSEPYGGGLALNLYGPPGTGKSMTAEAIAARLCRPLIRIKYAELLSKYPGDTNKAIVAAFRAAARAGAVLIFEEADTVLGSRLRQAATGADKSDNAAVNEMLAALDRHQGVVVFTSNLFEAYDRAFLRRIESIRLDLPDAACRQRLWQNLLPPALPLAADATPERLAQATDGFSGGDMMKVRRKAAARAALRSGVAGPVTWTDFAEAIAQERATKADHQSELRVVSETPVDPATLPPAARAAFDARAGTATEAT